MISDYLTKFMARVVLTSYITQTVAPVVYACEVEVLPVPGSPSKIRGDQHAFAGHPSFRAEGGIPGVGPAPQLPERNEALLKSQASTYQYRLSVKTKGASSDDIKLKLSRRTKGTEDSFEPLHKTRIHQGTLSSSSSEKNEHAKDILMNLINTTSAFYRLNFANAAGYEWKIAGLASLGISPEGGVILKQDLGNILLSSYDLVLKTSQDLFVESLKVASLTLESATTRLGFVSMDHLHVTHTAINEGGLHVRQITGPGTLVNHAHLQLEGTEEHPATMGIRHVVNKKTKRSAKDATIEGSHLRITEENQSFKNGNNARVALKSLVVEPLLGDATLHLKKDGAIETISLSPQEGIKPTTSGKYVPYSVFARKA